MRYALLLVLASCASGPSEYHRGTMVAPPAPAARPGVGAPVRGQPGMRPAYPRSPYTRTLPETPETMRQPGIWATRTPSANTGPTLDVLGAPIILPDNDPETVRVAQKCAAGTTAAMTETRERKEWLARPLQDDMRQCNVFLLWQQCMKADVWPDAFRGLAGRVADRSKTLRDCSKWELAVSHDVPRFLWNLRKWHNETQREAP